MYKTCKSLYKILKNHGIKCYYIIWNVLITHKFILIDERGESLKKKVKVISCLLSLFLAFQVVGPIKGHEAYGYSDNLIVNSYDPNVSAQDEVLEEDKVEMPDKGETTDTPDSGTVDTPDNGVVGTPDNGGVEIPENDVVDTPDNGQVEEPEDGQAQVPENGDINNPENNVGDTPEEGVTEIPEKDLNEVPEEDAGEIPVEESIDNLTMEYAEGNYVNAPEDIDKNGIINESDLDLLSSKYNLSKGQAGYVAAYDLNNDGIIDLYDLTKVSNKLNTKPVLKGKVTADALNVRSGPGTTYGSIGTLYQGNIIEILDDSNSSWYKINYNSGIGFVSSQYVSKYIEYINFNPPSGNKIIAIDPGHGGSDPGAVGPNGAKEKDITLNVAFKVRDLLQSYGYQVVMTRTGDYRLDENSTKDLEKRAQIANNNNASLFVSIHANSFDSTSKGTETFYHTREVAGSNACKLATAIQNKLIGALGLTNRGVKQEDFSVLRNTTMPAALTELAFISNPSEEALLITDQFQTKAARAIVDGILEYLK